MNVPFGSPPNWALLQGEADAKDRLRQLAADKREAKAELRQVLEGLAATGPPGKVANSWSKWIAHMRLRGRHFDALACGVGIRRTKKSVSRYENR